MISGLGFPRENIIPDMKLSDNIIALTGGAVNTMIKKIITHIQDMLQAFS